MNGRLSESALPAHFAKNEAQGFVGGTSVVQYELGDMRNFVYLLLDPVTKNAAIVDPQTDIDTPLGDLKKQGYTLTACLLTHTHHDHVAGVPELLKRFPTLPLYLHAEDEHRLKNIHEDTALKLLSDGEHFQIGNLKLQALHTPGHSAGELCYLLEGRLEHGLQVKTSYLFTGDTLFIRDCGRTDLPTGNNEEMFESLQRIKKLPGELVILPGHHYAPECASLLQNEILQSPPLRCRSVDELKALP